MRPSIGVRRATLEDTRAVATLFDAYRQFYGRPADPAKALAFIAARLQRRESTILMAEDQVGAAAGFCQLYPTFCSVEAAPILVLYDLFVVPALRRTVSGARS